MSSEAVATSNKQTVVIHVNGKVYKVAMPITGAELRALGEVPDGNQLFLEEHGDRPDTLIDTTASYTLKNGSQLYDLPRGTVGAESAVQLSIAQERLAAATIEENADGSCRLRWATVLAPGWSATDATLAVVVPPAYPAQGPSGFDLLGEISTADGRVPGGSGRQQVAGLPSTHFCWNPAGAIVYIAEDGLWRFAKFAENRFLVLP